MSFLLILGSGMLLIVLSADYFTNGIEWLGYRWGLGEGAVGSLLAALGTALPETLVPVIAIVFGGSRHNDAIGLGAIFGAPFMLASLGFAVIGTGLWLTRRGRRELKVSAAALTGDVGFFLASFGLALFAAVLPRVVHPLVAGLLIAGYGWHAWRLLSAGHGSEDTVNAPEHPLHLSPRQRPAWWAAAFQVLMALAGLVMGAHFFVLALGQVTDRVKISGFILSVILTPVATELPEVLNSIIWLRRGRDALAVGNVTGAMAFQASLVPALGILLTPWTLQPWEAVTGVLAWLSGLWIFLRARRGALGVAPLLSAGLFYLAFIVMVLVSY